MILILDCRICRLLPLVNLFWRKKAGGGEGEEEKHKGGREGRKLFTLILERRRRGKEMKSDMTE